MREWTAVMTDRLSFGFIGQLEWGRIGLNSVIIQLCDVRFSPDVFDRSVIGMSGVKYTLEIMPVAHGYVYVLAVSAQGALRIGYAPSAMIEHTPVAVAQPGVLIDDVIDSYRKVPVIQRMQVSITKDIWVWRDFLLKGDNEWETTEDCLAVNSKGWTQTTSILKKMLCPPIC